MASKFKNIDLGAGLLNATSQELATNEFQITYIPLEKLILNEKNEGFSMTEIEELKTSISEVGLQQNLVVTPNKDDTYRILSGHRRYLALSMLVNEGDTKYNRVPCVIKELSKILLPLDEETKEIYAIATTNAEIRNNTTADRLKLMDMLSTVYDKLKNNGYEKLGKRRDFIAERLGVSSGTVGTLSFIDKNISNEFKEDFNNDNIPVNVANEIAHLDSKTQEKLKIKTDDVSSLTVADVKSFADNESRKSDKRDTKKAVGNYEISSIDFKCFSELSALVENIPTGTVVKSKDYDKLQSCLAQIQKQQATIEKILLPAIQKNN